MPQPLQNRSIFSISKRDVDEIIEATNIVRGSKVRVEGSPSVTVASSPVMLKARNDSATLAPGSAVAITTPLNDAGQGPSHAVGKFRSQMAVACTAAYLNTATDAVDNFPTNLAVTKNTIRAGGVGDVIVSGLAYARVDLQSGDDSVAVAHDGVGMHGLFKGAANGRAGARFVAKPTLLGEQWCIVQAGLFPPEFANNYRCELAEALTTSDASVSVDTLIPLDGITTTASSLTAYNTLNLSGNDNDNAFITYNDAQGRWELIEVQC